MVTLSVQNLSAEYGTGRIRTHALHDVSFELRNGESVGIAGESACGKTTLGLAIMRMLHGGKVTSGEVTLDGDSLLDMGTSKFDRTVRWKQIAMVFQGAMGSLDPVFTVRAQFEEALKQHGFAGDHTASMVRSVESVGLEPDILGRYPHELSGGMRQRVVIAMALVLRPKLVIADEPTTALDVIVQAQIINLFKELKKSGTSFIFITHDLAVLSEIADKMGVMYGGELVEFGLSRNVYENPRHPYTQALLRSVPSMRGERPGYIAGSPPTLESPPDGCRFAARCPDAMDKCKKNPPELTAGDGSVRCWLYE